MILSPRKVLTLDPRLLGPDDDRIVNPQCSGLASGDGVPVLLNNGSFMLRPCPHRSGRRPDVTSHNGNGMLRTALGTTRQTFT